MTKLSAEQQRIAIAKDALTQFKNKKFDPSIGCYLWSGNPDNNNIITRESKCELCVKGALFLSALFSQSKYYVFSRSLNNENIIDYLKDIFKKEQLDLMENVFEQINRQRCYNDYSPYERMILILRNLIRNNGTFIIPRKYVRIENKIKYVS